MLGAAREEAPLWGPSRHGDLWRFRLWAPGQDRVSLRLGGEDRAMDRAEGGWFALDAEAAPGMDYGFVLDDGRFVPDPAARAQAGDVHGPSRLVDPGAYPWKHPDWAGRDWSEAVILELHTGTFTPEGTFRAAIGKLDHVAAAGFTAIELMPVAQFEGARGWGYDGVLLFAPHSAYGTPDDLRALVDAAHERGLMVFLDVVFNHFGASGNYLPSYAPEFFHPERETPWGQGIAYEIPAVRRFFIENALHWLGDYRLDGLRLDAVDFVRDPESEVEILAEIAREVRAAFPDRPVHLATEDNRNIVDLHPRGPDGAVPLHTAEWNDDFHNSAHVIATGEIEGYYVDFAEDHWPIFARILAEGFGYQGEYSAYGEAPRGVPSAGQPPLAFVDFLQNHDQIGNRAFGERLTTLAPSEKLRALTEILLLSPHVPLMFMGEEWGETRPFAFFTDFEGALAEQVREGRRREFARFAAFRDPATRGAIPDPNAPGTFEASKLDWAGPDSAEGAAALARTRALLATRAREIAPRLARAGGHAGAVRAAADGVIAVDWRLDGAVLRLRANLGAIPATAPEAAGRLIHGVAGAELDPCAVRVFIDEGASV